MKRRLSHNGALRDKVKRRVGTTRGTMDSYRDTLLFSPQLYILTRLMGEHIPRSNMPLLRNKSRRPETRSKVERNIVRIVNLKHY